MAKIFKKTSLEKRLTYLILTYSNMILSAVTIDSNLVLGLLFLALSIYMGVKYILSDLNNGK